jgi:hypothetical protein
MDGRKINIRTERLDPPQSADSMLARLAELMAEAPDKKS